MERAPQFPGSIPQWVGVGYLSLKHVPFVRLWSQSVTDTKHISERCVASFSSLKIKLRRPAQVSFPEVWHLKPSSESEGRGGCQGSALTSGESFLELL